MKRGLEIALRYTLGQRWRNSCSTKIDRSFSRSSTLWGQLVQFKLSDIGEGIAEVNIKEWHVKVGDTVKQFDALCEVQSDKATVTISSRYDGIVKKLHYKTDDVARVGQPLMDIELAEGSASTATPEKPTPAAARPDVPSAPSATVDREVVSKGSVAGKVPATPAVRRIAIENKVDLGAVRSTGKDGRVLKEDILRHIANSAQGGAASGDVGRRPVTSSPPAPLRHFAPAADRVQPIRGIMRVMVKTMTEANAIPHFGYCDEVLVDRLVDLRRQLKEVASEKGVKMSYMPLFVKAASLALLQFPILNASVDEKCENLLIKAAHNVCVAMDTPDGLVVPNIKHCEQRSVWEIAAELNRLSEAGRRGQLTKDDLGGGTFTLSNIGSIGGTYAKPVLFPPQVVIGALGKIQVLPRYKRNSLHDLYAAHVVRVSWAADHRVIDGATMARYSNVWKTYLEHPAMMIAEMK